MANEIEETTEATTTETQPATQPTAAERHMTALARLEEARGQLAEIEQQLAGLQAERAAGNRAIDDALAAAQRADGAVTKALNVLAETDAARMLATGGELAQLTAHYRQAETALEQAKATAKDARAKVVTVRAQAAKDGLALDDRADSLKEQRSQAQRLVDALQAKADELHAAAGAETLAAIRREHDELKALRDEALAMASAAQTKLAEAEAAAQMRLADWPDLRERAVDLVTPPPDAGNVVYSAALAFYDALVEHGAHLKPEWHNGIGPAQRLAFFSYDQMQALLLGDLGAGIIAQRRTELQRALGWAQDRIAHEEARRAQAAAK